MYNMYNKYFCIIFCGNFVHWLILFIDIMSIMNKRTCMGIFLPNLTTSSIIHSEQVGGAE